MCSASQLRMQELVDELNEAARTYYSDSNEPPMTDATYDRLMRDLICLEEETGVILPDSPTSRVGYEVVGDKIQHYSKILSLKDTKSIDELQHFLGEMEALLSWKLDGVSIVLYYLNSNLIKAVSRGDGLYGKDITKNVLLMRNIPKTIDLKSLLIVRGEGCLSLSEFEQINRTKEGEKYSNARNLAAGLINGTKTTSILLRHMSFIAHSIVHIEGVGRKIQTRHEQFAYLESIGFKVVPFTKVVNYTLNKAINDYEKGVENFEFPTDGLVLALDDISYGESLGATMKHPKHSMAFKWEDISVITTVRGMKWSVSQTGLITPVVLLEPVQLEGTIVKQANLHTLKIFKGLDIGIGDTVSVHKANMIIPEVEENLTRSRTEEYPRQCPICGGETTVVTSEKTEKLYCYHCGRKE